MTNFNPTISVRAGKLKKDLLEIAERENRTLSDLVLDVLKASVKKKKPKNPLAKYQGFDDTPVPDGDIRAYADSFKAKNNSSREDKLYELFD